MTAPMRLNPTAVAALVFMLILGAPSAHAETRAITFRVNHIVEIDFLAREASARAAGGDAKDYYREVDATIADHGGELLGVFDVYAVTNGILRPESVGVVQWPAATDTIAFKAAIDRAGLGIRTQVWRNFYRLDGAQDVTISVDDAKVYEFVTMVLNPLGAPAMAEFARKVLPIAGRDYSRRTLVEFVPADGAGSLRSEFVTARASITEWADRRISEAWIHNREIYGANVRKLLDPASDRRELIWTEPTRY